MLEQLREAAAAGLPGIFELAAEFCWRATDDDHLVLRSGEGPFGISGRHVLAGDVGGLVAGVAAHAVDAVAVLAAHDILHVDVAVIALERCVAGRVTVLAARRGEDFVDLQKGFAGSGGVRFRSWGCCVNGSDVRDGEQKNETERGKQERGTMMICFLCAHDLASLPAARSLARIGRRRMRLPVTAKMALVNAGATGGTLGSPTPVGFCSLGTM
jgi:hypothetical protein